MTAKVDAGFQKPVQRGIYLPGDMVTRISALAVEWDRSWNDTVRVLLKDALRILETRPQKWTNGGRMSKVAKQEPDFQTVANDYAHGAIENLRELCDRATAEDDDTCIQEDPLCVEVRSGWYGLSGGSSSGQKPAEYTILLGTGGPASRIIGELSEYGEPETANFEYQDWFKPWTRAETTPAENDTMLEYVRHFYF